MGHSFGSVIGIELLEKYPQDYKAYIGTGQVVDFVRNEQVVDLMRERTKLEVPVYFMLGRNDYDTPSKLAEMYFDEIEAPNKELIWFEESSHFPFYEEPEKFNRIMKMKFSN